MTLSHLTEAGEVHMVDITGKEKTRRRAVASGRVIFPEGILDDILHEGPPKGEFLAAARVAGIEAAKTTSQTIPMAHQVQLSFVSIDLTPEPERNHITITCEAKAEYATGVEMEALTGVSTAALTLYDMCKSEHKGIRITDISLLHKEGGKSGEWRAEGPEDDQPS